jgi:hypothetical protein
MSLAARRRAVRRRHRAQWLCLWHLRLRCYRILARRFHVKSGEIDLIVPRGPGARRHRGHGLRRHRFRQRLDLAPSTPPHRPDARALRGDAPGAWQAESWVGLAMVLPQSNRCTAAI